MERERVVKKMTTSVRLISFLWVAFIQLLLHVANTLHVPRQLITFVDPHPEFISIDCGASNNHLDPETGIWFQTDANFIETGKNYNISDAELKILYTLRSFPEGERNCYTLKPKQGKNNNYLIRAFFYYGNYDGAGVSPIFHLYLGVYHWDTIDTSNILIAPYYYVTEIIHSPTRDTINVCLVKGVRGIPYISALELRPLSNTIYQTPKPSNSLFFLQMRVDVGSTYSNSYSRYKDDMYDRMWYDEENLGLDQISLSTLVYKETNSTYKLPAEVMRSAIQSTNVSTSINSNWGFDSGQSLNYSVHFHFMEIQKLGRGQKRVINITLKDDHILSQPITLEYLKPVTISHQTNQGKYFNFSISATSKSDAPPILNAFEVYRLISPPSPTEERDVNAILEVKSAYNISNSDWQGDPCLPMEFAWKRLGCVSDINNNTRIVALNLSGNGFRGQIAPSLSQLTELVTLDLSFNDLSGSIPKFLAELPKLKTLNLTGNKLTGSIPKVLKEKSDLQLSVDDNPDLCLGDSCKRHKFVIPLISSSLALVVILSVSLGIWIFKTRKLKGRYLKGKQGSFSKSEIICITSNFENVLGRGGFGNVYLGTLRGGAKVAVKILSESGGQGSKEFQSEVKLLKLIHHKNLVRLIGYCDEEDIKALVYEYMSKGDLLQQLSDRNLNVLKWNERLQIAIDAATGLDYLHNGCKPPILHRDMKPHNILLNQNMQAKIADFGLSRALKNDSDTHMTTVVAGTYGYIAPELRISKKSDVYSFGIILFELITGKRAVIQISGEATHIVRWVTPLIEGGDIQNIMDPRLQGNFNAASAQKAIEVSMSCVSDNADERPDISRILVELKKCFKMDLEHEGSLITEIFAR